MIFGWLKAHVEPISWLVALFVSVVGAIAGFRKDPQLGLVGAVALLLLLTAAVALRVMLARETSLIADQDPIPVFSTSARRGAAIALGGIAVITVTLVVLPATRRFVRQAFVTSAPNKADDKVRPTLTPPKPTAMRSTAATLHILITGLRTRATESAPAIEDRIAEGMREQLRAMGRADVDVAIASESPTSDDEALRLGESRGAQVLIWGWYDATRLQLHVASRSPDRQPLETGEMPWNLRTPEPQFDFRRDVELPVRFLTLIALGQLEYAANRYAKGRDFFDKAVSDLPAGALQTSWTWHFFRARSLHLNADAQSLRRVHEPIICGYAQAIRLNPDSVDALNNLAIFLADFGREDGDEGTMSISEIATPAAMNCLKQAGLSEEVRDPEEYFFDRAAKLAPRSGVIFYNRALKEWNGSVEQYPAPDNTSVERLVRQALKNDRSIPGAHAILGIIEFDGGRWGQAAEQFGTALRLDQGFRGLRLNLAHAEMRLGKDVEAARLVDEELQLWPNDMDALITKGVLASRAQRFADAIRSFEAAAGAARHRLPLLLLSGAYARLGRWTDVDRTVQSLVPATQNEEEMSIPADANLVRYLSMLLAERAGRTPPDTAITVLAAETPEEERQIIHLYRTQNEPAPATFRTLALRCRTDDGMPEPEEWKPPCTPATPAARILAVYDVLDENVLWTLARRRRFYAGRG